MSFLVSDLASPFGHLFDGAKIAPRSEPKPEEKTYHTMEELEKEFFPLAFAKKIHDRAMEDPESAAAHLFENQMARIRGEEVCPECFTSVSG